MLLSLILWGVAIGFVEGACVWMAEQLILHNCGYG